MSKMNACHPAFTTWRRPVSNLAFPAVVLGALLAMASPAGAFDRTAGGFKVGVANPDEGDASFLVGAHAEFTERDSRWHLMPELTFWKDADNVSDLAVNANVFYHFQEQRRSTPYLGFGVGLNFFTIDVPGEDDHETELGINLLGGMLLPVSSGVTGFVEGRYVATELDQIMLLAGFTFTFSNRPDGERDAGEVPEVSE